LFSVTKRLVHFALGWQGVAQPRRRRLIGGARQLFAQRCVFARQPFDFRIQRAALISAGGACHRRALDCAQCNRAGSRIKPQETARRGRHGVTAVFSGCGFDWRSRLTSARRLRQSLRRQRQNQRHNTRLCHLEQSAHPNLRRR